MILHREHGEVGWLIRREKNYAPHIEVLPGLTSPSNRGPYHTTDRGGDKMAFTRNGYGPVYADILRPWIDRARTVVELGTFRGASLAIWSELFPYARVVGLDVDFRRFEANLSTLRARGGFIRGLPTLVEFDAFEPEIGPLTRALAGDSIDVFIDDGPHADSAIAATLRSVLPLMAEEFLYVIEDNDYVATRIRTDHPDLDVSAHGAITVIRRGDGAGARATP